MLLLNFLSSRFDVMGDMMYVVEFFIPLNINNFSQIREELQYDHRGRYC